MSRQSTIASDFGGFDRKSNTDLWKIWTKNLPENHVFVFAGSYFEARAFAQTVFHASFDAFDGEQLDKHQTEIQAGSIIALCLRKDGKPTGAFKKFRTSKSFQANNIDYAEISEI